MPTRTFMAIEPEPQAVDALVKAQRVLADCGAVVRWTARENLHITLKFLGDVKDERLGEVCRVAERAAAETPAFEFDLDGLKAMPPGGQLRMIWAAMTDPEARMAALAQRLNSELAAMGFPLETRSFAPHITLGRIKSGRNVAALRRAAAEYELPDLQPQYADRLIVFASELTKAGPIYTPISTAELG